jgi:hypothetical protein
LINLLISRDTSRSETMRSILGDTHITFIAHRQRSRTSWSSWCNVCGLGWHLHVAMSLFILLSIWYNALTYFELVGIIEVKYIGVVIIRVDILVYFLSILTIVLSYI